MKKRKNKLVFRSRPQDHLVRLYEFLKRYNQKYGFWPSKREVAKHYNTHHSTVGYWYQLMIEQKMMKPTPGRARAIVLLPLENANDTPR